MMCSHVDVVECHDKKFLLINNYDANYHIVEREKSEGYNRQRVNQNVKFKVASRTAINSSIVICFETSNVMFHNVSLILFFVHRSKSELKIFAIFAEFRNKNTLNERR